MPDNIVYTYTIPAIAGSLSYMPVVASDSAGSTMTYSLSGNPDYITIDSATGYLRTTTNLYGITETPPFYVIVSNGFTSISRLIKLRVAQEINVEYLIVGAGGGGGSDMGGGGGGGGVLSGNVVLDLNATHTVTVGAGGTGAVAGTRVPRGTVGGSSSLLKSSEVDAGGLTRSNSIFFDGDSDAISAPPIAALNLNLYNNWTIEGWFYRNASLGNNGSVMSLGTGGSQLFYQMWVGLTNGEVQFGMGTGGWAWQSGFPVTSPIGLIRLNTWHHVAIVRAGVNTLLMFVDGALRYANGSLNFGTATTGGTFSLGSYFFNINGDGSWFNGYVSNFRIVNGTSVYSINFTPPTGPLVAVAGTTLLTCQTDNLIDSSLNNLPITRFGDTVAQYVNPFGLTTSAIASTFFDGTGDYLSVGQTTQTDLGSGSFTLEMWVYFTGINAVNVNITGKWNSSSQWILQLRGPGQDSIANQHWRFYFNTSSGFDFTESSTTSVTTGVWYHIAMVRNGSAWCFFRNGTLIGAGNNSTAVTPTSDTLTIGTAQNNTSNLQGYIFNYRLVVGTAIYTANFTPSTSALTTVANTVTLLCQTSTATTDSAGNLTLSVGSGNPYTTTFNPFLVGEQSTKANAQPFVRNIVTVNSNIDGATPILPTVANVNGRLYNVHTITSGNATLTIDQVGTDRIEIFLWGAGGAGGRPGGWGTGSYGGGGAAVRTEITPTLYSRYYVAIGGGGNYNSGAAGGNMGGGSACFNGTDNSYGGGGGGFTALYNSNVYNSQTVLLLAAGGGGGGSSRAGSANRGGAGGYPNGQNGFSPYDGKTSYAGRGGTQFIPGADASSDSANTAGNQALFQGGNSRTNSYGGGGGGGWMGGSGGGYSEANTMGGGGGGSSYSANSPLLVNTAFSNGNLDIPGDVGNYLRTSGGYQAGYGGSNSNGGQNGIAIVRYPIESKYITNFYSVNDQNYSQSRIAQGGGAGATTHDITTTNTPASSGASGGGASGQLSNFGWGIPGQGFTGGFSGGQWYPAGGGGAGNRNVTSADSNQMFSTGLVYNTGGAGVLNTILGRILYWGGGGGGAGYTSYGGNGGLGGGGGGAPRSSLTSTTDGYGDTNGINFAGNGTVGTLNSQTNVPGGAGGINTGGGGGGGSHYNVNNNGGNGGSGIVIARYIGAPWFAGGNISTLGNYTVHTFTSSGFLQGYVFTITPGAQSIFEGESIVYQVSGVNVPNNTRLYYTLRNTSTISSNDIISANGSFTVSSIGSNQVTGSFIFSTVEDLLFEGNETVNLDLRINSVTGFIVAQANTVIVRESLPAPVANISISIPKRVYTEGENVVATVVSNSAIPNGTQLWWTTNGEITSTDLSPSSGTTTFLNNSATIVTLPTIDPDTALERFFINLRTRSFDSLIYKISDPIYIFSTAGTSGVDVTANSIFEGQSVTFTLVTSGLPDGINIFWENVGSTNAADFNDGLMSGNATLSNGSVTVTRTTNFDIVDENTESIVLNFRLISAADLILATSPNVSLVDFGSITITSNVSSVFEGNTVLYTVTTSPNVPNGTVLYWSLSGNVSATDFAGNINSGVAYINNSQTSISIVPALDRYEGVVETMILDIRVSSPSGAIKASADPVQVFDAAPTFTITSNIAGGSITEGSGVRFTITSNNVPNLSTYYWTLGGTLSSADLVGGIASGSIVINNDNAFIDFGVLDDAVAENTEYLSFDLRTDSTSGPIVASAPSIVVNDLILGELLLIGGGGPGGYANGGNHNAGGGGAGGYVSLPVRLAKLTQYYVTIGAGGARPVWTDQGDPVYNGTASSFFSNANVTMYSSGSISTANIVALGGGYGQGGIINAGNYGGNGGSGGGGSGGIYGSPGVAIQNSTYGYGSGNNGGSSNQFGQPGGGGGAGAVGGFGGTSSNRVGGAGLANPFPAAHSTVGQLSGGVYYLAGGGGGTGSVGGVGGGGSATYSTNGCTAGLPNTGGGGGAGGADGNPEQGQAGGSGVAVIRYPGNTVLGTGGNATAIGGYVYHTFTTSGILNLALFTGTISANTLTVTEGNTVGFTVSTTNVSDGSVFYWINTGTTNGVTDFTSASNQGTFTVTNNSGFFTITVANDRATEGPETMVIDLRYGSAGGILLATSQTITVTDTSLTPVYTITPNVATILESGSVSYSITTGNVVPGTTIFWTNSGTTSAADFASGQNSGNVVINGTYASGSASFVVTSALDSATEGSETIIIQLRENSIAGPIVATSSAVTVLDATYSITPSTTTITEGQSVTFTIATTNILPGTVLYWTNAGSTTGSDFSDGLNSGNVTITGTQASGSASITLNTVADLVADPGETIVLQLRINSTSGTVVATAATVTVNDANPIVALDFVIVGGGGGGGKDIGGGGGAGGFWYSVNSGTGSNYSGSKTFYRYGTYTVGVGGGGSGATSTSSRGGTGGNSSISGPGINITALGGGGGAGRLSTPGGGSGGSGGGGALNIGAGAAGSGSSPQGNNGAPGAGDGLGGSGTLNSWGGGGGGAGSAGSGRNGGNGAQSVYGSFFEWTYTLGLTAGGFAGGGAGGTFDNSVQGTVDTNSGGGLASTSGQNVNGGNGVQYSGGGGGGQSSAGSGSGGSGGSGIVIIRYITGSLNITGGTAYVGGSYTYRAFFGGGSFTIN